ncbi:hypothetical protein [Desulfurivibrio alkaliphilus]|nr:hypothetical protein [Desulfurivibrio alkaliphilus]
MESKQYFSSFWGGKHGKIWYICRLPGAPLTPAAPQEGSPAQPMANLP